MRTLILGGTRSGKSAYAEALVAHSAKVRYVATARPLDAEMAERITQHRERRPARWELVEIGANLAPAVAAVPAGCTVLIDGLTLWLASVLDTDADPIVTIEAAVEQLLALPDLVVVSDEVSGGLVPENALARRFKDLAGTMHQHLAARFDRVVLVTAGLPMELKAPVSKTGTMDPS